MYSIYNRVVGKYDVPTLFLLAIFDNNHEYIIPPIDLNAIVESGNVKHLVEVEVEVNVDHNIMTSRGASYPSNTIDHPPNTISHPSNGRMINIKDIFSKIAEYSKHNICFEGFVLQIIQPDHSITRIKIKNPYYLVQHTLKYRGWVKATAELLIPLIIDDMHDVILSNCSNNNNINNREIRKRIDYYIGIINNEKNKILEEISFCVSSNRTDRKEYIERLNNKNLLNTWGSLLLKIFDKSTDTILTSNEIDDIIHQQYKTHLKKMLKNIPEFNDNPFIDHKHDILNCNRTPNKEYMIMMSNDFINDGLSIQPQTHCSSSGPSTSCSSISSSSPNYSQISNNKYYCYCGCMIIATRLRYDHTIYKICRCGTNYGIKTYKSGTMLMICENNECCCTHEIKLSNNGTYVPLGIPSSTFFKSLRLQIHEIINQTKHKTKDECYTMISNIINKPRKQTHMALLGITDCMKIIDNWY